MQQNYALMFLVWMGRLIQRDQAFICPDNPMVLKLDAVASGHFLIGRDEKNTPFLAIPVEFMPFFVQIDWMEVSICREEGYLYLEARDPVTQALNMALGLSIREKRLNVICLAGIETPSNMTMSMKVFKQNPKDPSDVIVSDQNELVGLPIKEVSSVHEIGTQMEIDEAFRLFEKTGQGGGFTALKV